MIIATALKEVFKGLQINDIDSSSMRNVQFHYGDQKELLLWVKNRGNLEKYPLVWYVLNDYTEFEGYYTVNARIVLMQVTRFNEMNTWRSDITYSKILNPLSKLVQNRLIQDVFISINGDIDTRFNQRDEPKYGLSRNNDETGGASKSINQDFVDAKILTFKMIIKPECIIK